MYLNIRQVYPPQRSHYSLLTAVFESIYNRSPVVFLLFAFSTMKVLAILTVVSFTLAQYTPMLVAWGANKTVAIDSKPSGLINLSSLESYLLKNFDLKLFLKGIQEFSERTENKESVSLLDKDLDLFDNLMSGLKKSEMIGQLIAEVAVYRHSKEVFEGNGLERCEEKYPETFPGDDKFWVEKTRCFFSAIARALTGDIPFDLFFSRLSDPAQNAYDEYAKRL